jgi:multimeric flavodoxin WrbA
MIRMVQARRFPHMEPNIARRRLSIAATFCSQRGGRPRARLPAARGCLAFCNVKTHLVNLPKVKLREKPWVRLIYEAMRFVDTGSLQVHTGVMPTRKIAAFLGSPRAGGNTETLTESVLEGAREVGCETRSFFLRTLNLRPCDACGDCWKDGKACVIDDDGAALYAAMAESDVFLFSTPVYWYGPTAIMKAFVDRLVVFNKPEGRPLVRGKAALLVSAWEEKGMRSVEPMVRLFEMSFEYLELRFEGSLLLDELGPKEAVRDRPGALESARALGRSLT